jgi:hypothetical protein
MLISTGLKVTHRQGTRQGRQGASRSRCSVGALGVHPPCARTTPKLVPPDLWICRPKAPNGPRRNRPSHQRDLIAAMQRAAAAASAQQRHADQPSVCSSQVGELPAPLQRDFFAFVYRASHSTKVGLNHLGPSGGGSARGGTRTVSRCHLAQLRQRVGSGRSCGRRWWRGSRQ